MKAVAVTSLALLLPSLVVGWAAWFISAGVSILIYGRPRGFTFVVGACVAAAAFATFFRWTYQKFRKRVVADAEIRSLEASMR